MSVVSVLYNVAPAAARRRDSLGLFMATTIDDPGTGEPEDIEFLDLGRGVRSAFSVARADNR
jgi:hypothetical protein